MSYILVIDDEECILNMINQALSAFGHCVDTAASGGEGIQKFNSCRFDLVITDICMPGTDGLAVLAHIRASDIKQTPTIGISGTPWLLDNSDFDCILPKPFPIKTLIETIKDLSDHSPAQAVTA